MAKGQTEMNTALTFRVGGESGKDYVAAPDEFPLANVIAMFTRQVKHVLQNEVAAGAGNTVLAELNVAKDATKDAKKAILVAYREEHPAEWLATLLVEADKKWNQLLTGSISANDRVRVDPYERELLKLIDAKIRADFANVKGTDGKPLKVPANATDTVVFASGATRTREDLRNSVRGKADVMAEFAEKARDIVALGKVEKPAAESANPEDMGY